MAFGSESGPTGEAKDKRRSPYALLAGSILIGMALALVLFGSSLLSTAEKQEEISALEQLPDAVDESTVVLSSSGRLMEIGDRAPNFASKDLEGNTHELSALHGRPVVVNFWATWCIPCRVEMPELQLAYEQHQEEGLAILALNYDEPARTVRGFFLEEMGLTFTPLLDVDGMVARRFGVYNFPTTFFIDAEGVIKSIHRGPMVRQQIEGHLSKIVPIEQ